MPDETRHSQADEALIIPSDLSDRYGRHIQLHTRHVVYKDVRLQKKSPKIAYSSRPLRTPSAFTADGRRTRRGNYSTVTLLRTEQ